MKTLAIIILFATIPSSFCESELTASVMEGEDYNYNWDFEGGEKTIGVKRILRDESGDGDWQFYYFCEKSKGDNKKKCGSWVDKKGNKIKGATNKVTLKGKEAVISKITVKDAGGYTSIFEDPKQTTGIVRLYVGTRPPPPPLNRNNAYA